MIADFSSGSPGTETDTAAACVRRFWMRTCPWDYKRRKGRSGEFWEGRYFATMIDSGDYLWNAFVTWS